jgi:hypothetical protein
MTTEESSSTEKDDTPEHLRPLYDDWFGEAAAPLLFRAINLESWDLCRRLLEERDRSVACNELEHIDLYGYSAVHYACWWSSTPIDMLTHILDCSPPDYPSKRNRKGRTPLHLAAWRGRDEVVELLASQCPEAASVVDRNQKSPLLDACSRNRSKRVLDALLQADPTQIVQKNNQDRTPALTFFRISHGFVSAPHRTQFSSAEEQAAYASKVQGILAAERKMQHKSSFNNTGISDDWNFLQAAMESPSCPFTYVKWLLDKVETRIGGFRDETGNTLLHLAAQADPFESEEFYKCDRCSNNNHSQDPNGRGAQEKMYFNRDPDKAHWGVRCYNPNCYRRGHNRSVMIHYVQVPVGKFLSFWISVGCGACFGGAFSPHSLCLCCVR